MNPAPLHPDHQPAARQPREAVLKVRGVTVAFGRHTVLENLDLDVWRGEILGFVGASGSGKSVLMRAVLGLNRPQAGDIEIFGVDYAAADDEERMALDQRIGVLFQHGALFSALSVLENIQVPMREYLDLSPRLMDELARLKLELVGLPQDAAAKLPSELSGGMIKRAALARALALDPELLFLDEPTAGLDPIGAAGFDALTRELQATLGLTVFLITHDLDTLYEICDRVAVLADGKVIAIGTIPELVALDHPWIQEYFNGPRGRAAKSSHERAQGGNGPASAAPGVGMDKSDKAGA